MKQDLHYAIRTLLRNRAFTIMAVASLALGIGANTAIFSVVNAVLLEPPPFSEPERLALVWGSEPERGRTRGQTSATDVYDWRSRSASFEEMAFFMGWSPIVSGDGEPERIPAMQVSEGYFDVMKMTPAVGRLFLPEEQEEGRDFVVVLSYGLWQRRFGGDPGIVGKTIALNSRNYSIVGVLPADAKPLPTTLVGNGADVYRPIAEPYDETQRDARHVRCIGRLKVGVSLEQAQAEMSGIAASIAAEHPDENAGYGVRLVSLHEDTVGSLRPALLTLLAAVAFVLLIACANVGNLLLARSAGRRKEIAIRAALGATRGRLVRQFLAESLVLSVLGGAVGLLLALWGTGLVESIGVRALPMLSGVRIDAAVLGFTVLVSLLAGVVFGLAPALHAASPDLDEALRDGGRTSNAPSGGRRIRGALVVSEVALSLVLLVCSGLMIRSIAALRAVDPGFDPKNVLTMNVSLPGAKYRGAEAIGGFFDRVAERAEALPGVQAAGFTSVLPASTNFDKRGMQVEGVAYGPGEEPDPDAYMVTPNYLHAMSIPVLSGRGFSAQDRPDSQFVVLVSETAARQLWPGEDAVGRRIRTSGAPPGETSPWRTVVGIVGDVRQYGLDTQPSPAVYFPQMQFPASYSTLVVKTSSDPLALAAAVRREILDVDRDQPVFAVASMEQVLAESISVRRFSMLLLGLFAAVALVLAAVGIYGVISYTVTQRTHEIGIRMALGAQTRDVLGMVLGQGMAMAAAGIGIGLGVSFVATRMLSSLLYGVSATDPLTFGAIALLLASVAALATYIPARRAARVDPIRALRHE